MDLTTLDKAKAWAGATSSTDDRALERLVSQISQVILTYIQRPYILKRQFTERLNGRNNHRMMLRQYPVLSVDSLVIGNQIIQPAATPMDTGFVLEPWNGFAPGQPQQLSLNGHLFERGNSNVQITYTAGFFVTAEPHTVTESNIHVDGPDGSWAADGGVTYANGTALTKVTGTPTVGQYALGSAPGHYVFASEDVNAAVFISYSYIPAVLEQACIDIFAERLSYQDRIGQKSKTMNGSETVSFNLTDMPAYTKTALAPFMRMVPI